MTRLLGAATAAFAMLLAIGAGAQTFLGTWTTGTQLPNVRSEDSVAAIGSVLYVVGGYAPAGPHPTALDASGQIDVDQPLVTAFNLQTGRWSDHAPLPRGLNHVGLTAFDGKLYAFRVIKVDPVLLSVDLIKSFELEIKV